MPDNPTQLEPEQRARRIQVQHDDREILVLNGVEPQIDAGHQEGVGIPSRRAVDFKRNLSCRVRPSQRSGGSLAD